MAGDLLREVLRRKRATEIAAEVAAAAVLEYRRAVMRLYDESGLSYGQIAPLLGITRSRVQQIVEDARKT